MQLYKIEVYYQTGNTFETYFDSKIIENSDCKNYKYNSDRHLKVGLEEARLIRNRIEEHAAWYQAKNSIWKDDLPRPSWLKKHKYDTCINIEFEDKSYEIYAGSWCGFFETFQRVELKHV